MNQYIALCDANNFYCSCETLFAPDLAGQPLAVLSNNDGAVISRNSLAKQMDIPMGVPAFQIRHLIEQDKLTVRSSNYALYGDMSSRFMSVLEQFSPNVEVYSIDEAFVDLSGHLPAELDSIGKEIKGRVHQWTGLPICVGISTTKTLSKLANGGAKKFPATGGVVDLTDPKRQLRLMKIMPVDQVWGVGRKISKKLQQHNILSAFDLAKSNQNWIRRNFSVVLERTVCELNGESCIPFYEEATGNKHQIIVSRSFGERVTRKQELHSALASFASRACEKLRSQGKFARDAMAFIRTDPFKENMPQDHQNIRLAIPVPTNDTRTFLKQLEPALNQLHKEGFEYKKAGFMLMDLCDPEGFQGDLLSDSSLPETSPMMTALDDINRRVTFLPTTSISVVQTLLFPI